MEYAFNLYIVGNDGNRIRVGKYQLDDLAFVLSQLITFWRLYGDLDTIDKIEIATTWDVSGIINLKDRIEKNTPNK